MGRWLLFALVGGCGGNDAPADGPSSDRPPDATDTGTVDPTDTGAGPIDTGSEQQPPVLTEVTAVVHAEIGSVVVVSWTQDVPADVHAEYSFDAGVWHSSPLRAVEAGPHEELLLGVPYDMELTWRVVADGTGGQTLSGDDTIRTDPLPPSMPVPVIVEDVPADQDAASPYVFTSLNEVNPGFNDRFWALILDRKGRVVWGKRTPFQRMHVHARPDRDNTSLLLDHNSFWTIFDLGAASTIERTLIDGSVTETFVTPGLHHPFTELPDGTVAYGAARSFSSEAIHIAYPDGSNTMLWDCDAWLGSVPGGCASNTLNYDDASNTLLFSLYSVETIVEIDLATATETRWFGHVPGSYAFDPPESAFWWQHGGHWTDAGTLLTSSKGTNDSNVTVVREYSVDPVSQTLTEVWSFGEAEGVYGSTMGEAHRLTNGNTLHNYGSTPRLREVTPDGQVVWDAVWDGQHNIGRSTVLQDLYLLAPARP